MISNFNYPKASDYAEDNIRGNPVHAYLNRNKLKEQFMDDSCVIKNKNIIDINNPLAIKITPDQYKEIINNYNGTINWKRSSRYIFEEKNHSFKKIEHLKKQLLSKLLKINKRDHLTIYSILINRNDFQLTNNLLYTILQT